MIGGNCMRADFESGWGEKKSFAMRGEYEWEINWMKLYAIKVYSFWMWCGSRKCSRGKMLNCFFLLLAAIDDLRGWMKGLIMRVCTGSHALKFFFPSISFNYDAWWSQRFLPRSSMILATLWSQIFLIAVINELEGLSRGIKPSATAPIVVTSTLGQQQSVAPRIGNRIDPQHAAFVAQASKDALVFLKSKNPAVK